jgi:hypothetical protein
MWMKAKCNFIKYYFIVYQFNDKKKLFLKEQLLF